MVGASSVQQINLPTTSSILIIASICSHASDILATSHLAHQRVICALLGFTNARDSLVRHCARTQ